MIIATSTESQMLGITCYSHLIVIVEHFLSFKVKRIRYSENRNNNDPIYGVLFSKTILYLRNSQDLYQNLTLYFTGRACVTRVSDNEVHCPRGDQAVSADNASRPHNCGNKRAFI